MSDAIQSVRELWEAWYEYEKAMPWIHGRPPPAVASKIEAVIAELEAAKVALSNADHRANLLIDDTSKLRRELEAVTKERDKLREALEFVSTHTEHIEGSDKECQVCKAVDEALKAK